MINDQHVVLEQHYSYPIHQVWRALTDLSEMKQWYFPMLEDFRPEVGFETRFNVHHNGKDFPHHWVVTQADRPNHLAYEWKFDGYQGDSLAEFILTENPAGTDAKFAFTILEPFDTGSHPELSAENFRLGWIQLMDSLENHLKSKQ